MIHQPITDNFLIELREQLLQLPASGPDGFEGLVATALADLTGLTFRLAKSGLQFGRDASTPRGRFAIAMEAKRYSEPLSLENVAGKIWIASHELASDVDLWALCATSEVGDGVLAKLEQMLEEHGISLLMLDWTAAPLPRLAVLLAAAKVKVEQWCTKHFSVQDVSKIANILTTVEADSAFSSARDQLKQDASAEFSGLAALAEANLIWCNQVFSERTASQQAFGQYLTVSDLARPPIPRPSLEMALGSALSSEQKSSECVAILGPEGTGKSWLAARWWVSASDKPILVIGSSQVAELISPRDPLKTLANLIADQGKGDSDELSKRWWRRLNRWQSHSLPVANGQNRFLVLLDGLNERSGIAWSTCILSLCLEINKLGGQLLLTCRERFWDREIAPRLAGLSITRIRVGDFTPEELDKLLRQRDISIDSISEQVRGFIRNPRICSVALDLLDRLSTQADELTIERLLLEYWRRRLEERGDLIAHNIGDFEKLLRSHAKALRENPGVQFDRDEWREHSGAARRDDGRSVENDLTDIEEGAFLQVVEDRDGYYEFKTDIVPFALGLLVARELQDELRKPNRNPAEVIDSIIEEVQGFDLVGDVLRAAAGIACFEENYQPNGRAALISAWLALQNIPNSGIEVLAAYTATCPEGVLDTIEIAFGERTIHRRRDWLLEALLNMRDRPRVEAALKPRIRKWLGRWSRTPLHWGPQRKEDDVRFRERTQRISDKLNSLTPAELDFLAKKCDEVDEPESMQLDAVATLLMAGQPIADQAEGVLTWAFAWTLTGDLRRADADLCWVVRLNKIDFFEFEFNLREAITAMLTSSDSDVSRSAVAIALRVLGTVVASTEAERLYPRQSGEVWRSIENYCMTDPFDPSSTRPSNLINAIREAKAIIPEQVWSQYVVGEKDLLLEWITPGLTRFEPEAIIPLLRDVARTIETRSQLPLRQLSWNLPRLSPLFDYETLASVLAGFKRLVQQPCLVDPSDQDHVAGSILLSLLPHFSAYDQLQLFLELPHEVGDWYKFRKVFKPLNLSELEKSLRVVESDPVRLRRTLFFVSSHPHTLNDQSRAILGRTLEHDDPLVVTCVSDVAYVTKDSVLDELIIANARRRGGNFDGGNETYWRDRAVASAVVSLKRYDDINLIAPCFVGFAAEHLGGEFDSRMATVINLIFERLLNPIQTPEPQHSRLSLEVDRADQTKFYTMEDCAKEGSEDMIDFLRARAKKLSESRQGLDSDDKRLKTLQKEAETYLDQLRTEKTLPLAYEPDIIALKRLVIRDPERVISYADTILAETNQVRLSTVRNFALGLAEAFSDNKPDLTVALLNQVMDVRSPVSIKYGQARIPQEIVILFSGPEVDILSGLRGSVLDRAATDADLETLIFAAESAEHTSWLQNWIEREIESGLPCRIARGLTIEGLRNAERGESLLLGCDWGSGFLGQVAQKARFNHDRNAWSKTWLDQATEASDPVQFWRWGELGAGIADFRAFHWLTTNPDTPMMKQFGSELFARIRQTAEKRTKKRKDTLFGIDKPTQRLAQQIFRR